MPIKNFGDKILTRELGSKYINYRKKWAEASEKKLLTDFPLYIQLENTGKCNLRCQACIHGIPEFKENYSKGLEPLSLDLYKRILAEAKEYNCPSISFHNYDEPLLMPDLEDRIAMARNAGFMDLILVTNASLLAKERADKLLRSGLTKINFSVDGWNEKTYNKARIGGSFEAVLKNIEYFLKQKKKLNLKLPITRVTSVLSRLTYLEADDFLKFWEKRVDLVEFQNFQVIKNRTEDLIPPGARIDNDFYCSSPWQQIMIRPNGDVYPCCSYYGLGLKLGNIKKSTIYEIWHSKEIEEIRKSISDNNFSPSCEACSKSFFII